MSFILQVNGFQFHPSLPLAATASGHRRYFLEPSSDDSSDDDDENSGNKGGTRSVSCSPLAT